MDDNHERRERDPQPPEDLVDEALRESFPASDPPSFVPTAGSPRQMTSPASGSAGAAGPGGRGTGSARSPAMTIEVSSPAFEPGSPIPDRYARDGDDRSPPLRFSNLPPATAELALICEDPDAPTKHPFVHWVLYGIAADTAELPEGTDLGTPGTNDWGEQCYGGPQPPVGHGVHHYHFKVFALDRKLELQPGASRDAVVEAMRGHLLADGELVGTYERGARGG